MFTISTAIFSASTIVDIYVTTIRVMIAVACEQSLQKSLRPSSLRAPLF